jgi:hypothetical protein
MNEDALVSPGARAAAADRPAAGPTPAAADLAAPHRPAGGFPPRLEIAPLTIRPAAAFAFDREMASRPVC